MFERHRKIVTRIAPSPTGHLHIGTARTALFNFLFTQQRGGELILRSEDTDTERSTKAFEAEIEDGLAWLGLSWDSSYRQSERTDIYTTHLEQLVKSGAAYVSREESRRDPSVEIDVVRLRNPNKTVTFTDAVRGEVAFDTTELGDFVIARGLQDPLYHFAVVVDDYDMGVTHVIRGEDHISNTPRQILIQEAVGAERPVYAHLPLILAPDRSKLSKRHGAVSVNEYRDAGFLPEAIVNYLALLGWNPGTNQELFTLDELIEEFRLDGIQKGGAIFNLEKLKWFNKEHLKNISKETFREMVEARLPEATKRLPQYSQERLERLMPTIAERVSVAEEISKAVAEGEYDFAFSEPTLNLELMKWKNDTNIRQTLSRLQKLAEIVSTVPEDALPDEVKDRIWDYALEAGKGEVLWPLRVALTGRAQSPDPFTVIYIIGSAEAYNRLRKACDTILQTT